MLYLAGVSPAEISERFVTLRAAFRGRDEKVGPEDLAILCLLARPIDAIVEVVLRYGHRMPSLGLAIALAFVGLAGQDRKLAVLADAKLLLDAQRVSAAQVMGWTLLPG